MITKILVKNTIRCKHCGDIIESTNCHDFKYCSCKRCAVDGGLDYLRRCGELDDWEDLSEYKEIEVTPKYKVGDIVIFEYFVYVIKGTIQAVNIYPNSTNVHYDILDEQASKLYENINERDVMGK